MATTRVNILGILLQYPHPFYGRGEGRGEGEEEGGSLEAKLREYLKLTALTDIHAVLVEVVVAS